MDEEKVVEKKVVNRPKYKALLEAEYLAHDKTRSELDKLIVEYRDYRNTRWWNRVWTFLTKYPNPASISASRTMAIKG